MGTSISAIDSNGNHCDLTRTQNDYDKNYHDISLYPPKISNGKISRFVLEFNDRKNQQAKSLIRKNLIKEIEKCEWIIADLSIIHKMFVEENNEDIIIQKIKDLYTRTSFLKEKRKDLLSSLLFDETKNKAEFNDIIKFITQDSDFYENKLNSYIDILPLEVTKACPCLFNIFIRTLNNYILIKSILILPRDIINIIKIYLIQVLMNKFISINYDAMESVINEIRRAPLSKIQQDCDCFNNYS